MAIFFGGLRLTLAVRHQSNAPAQRSRLRQTAGSSVIPPTVHHARPQTWRKPYHHHGRRILGWLLPPAWQWRTCESGCGTPCARSARTAHKRPTRRACREQSTRACNAEARVAQLHAAAERAEERAARYRAAMRLRSATERTARDRCNASCTVLAARRLMRACLLQTLPAQCTASHDSAAAGHGGGIGPVAGVWRRGTASSGSVSVWVGCDAGGSGAGRGARSCRCALPLHCTKLGGNCNVASQTLRIPYQVLLREPGSALAAAHRALCVACGALPATDIAGDVVAPLEWDDAGLPVLVGVSG